MASWITAFDAKEEILLNRENKAVPIRTLLMELIGCWGVVFEINGLNYWLSDKKGKTRHFKTLQSAMKDIIFIHDGGYFDLRVMPNGKDDGVPF